MASSKQPLANSSAAPQLTALQNELKTILSPSAPPDAHIRLSAAVFRACQLSITALHQEKRCKDEIWHLLRGVSINPSDSQLEQISERIYQLNKTITNDLSDLRINRYDDRLSSWNDEATSVFEQMALTSGSGKRVHEQRQSASSSSVAGSSQSQPQSSTKSRSSKSRGPDASSIEPSWLRLRCAKLQTVRDGSLSAHEMAATILNVLDSSDSDDQIQGDLFDAFGGDFEAVIDVLSRRQGIRVNSDAILADCSQAHEISAQGLSTSDVVRGRGVRDRNRSNNNRSAAVFGEHITVRDSRQQAMHKKQEREMRRLVKAGLIMEEEPNEEDDFAVQDLGGSQFEERARAFGTDTDRDVALGTIERITLPFGSTREVGKGYEEIFVPPPQREPSREEDLVDITAALSGHPELLRAMRGVKTLNRLQSAVYPMAFKSNENILVCAPTGAGKTNVALLTIFHEIVSVKTRQKRAFKVVYVAPMKALAAEVTEKFGKRLKPLGLKVREFTGDMSLSRLEALETHVLVTTPEKWDVVTRKSGSELGDLVTLFVVDEIHLLHDERGAVLESIVARTLRLSETAQRPIRLVGLSATLPNYADVGSFMKVDPSRGLFHFDGSHRPVPLSQTFIGVSEGSNSTSSEARRRRDAKMHELAWEKVKDSLQRGHQAMIFVHSRKGTTSAAREMISRAAKDEVENIFFGANDQEENSMVQSEGQAEEEEANLMPSWATREIAKSRTADIRELCAKGVGVHNAGLPRSDRQLVEKLFAEGAIRLLCCTATLAWGVNLPARTVVIMGTEVYSAEKGGFSQLGVLDVTQIFGRAGRPQFDTEGEGTIITEHDHLAKYLNMLTSSIPIESQLGASVSRMADHLNAEIVSGTVSSIGDGVRWLNYTYLRVRMPQNPLVYGIEWEEVAADRELHSRKAKVIEDAAKLLDDVHMCRYHTDTGMLVPSDLGRVSSHFYVSHETILRWNEVFSKLRDKGAAIEEKDWMNMYSLVIHAVSQATEFEQMRSRQDEADELETLSRNYCPIPLKSGSETREGKVAILLQAHVSRANVRMSDLSYIVQSATRLLRGIFEISLRKGYGSFSLAALELARASESRIWPFQHPLWQFTYLSRRDKSLLINPETIANIESGGEKHDLYALRTMTREELSVLIRAPKIANAVQKAIRALPTLEITKATIAPLAHGLFKVQLTICATFNWVDAIHGRAESWWIWIDDLGEDRIYHYQKLLLTRKQVQSLNEEVYHGNGSRSKQTLELTFPVAVFDPPATQYWVHVESDRWHIGDRDSTPLTVANMVLPQESMFRSDPCNMPPVSVMSSLPPQEAALYSEFTRFSPLQTQLLKLARHGTEDIFVSAPSGSGKMAVSEFGILNAFQNKRDKTVVLITGDVTAIELLEVRSREIVKLGKGPAVTIWPQNVPQSISILQSASMVITSAASWIRVIQQSSVEEINEIVSLFIFHDIELMANQRSVGMEVFMSHLRGYRYSIGGQSQTRDTCIPRIIGLCSSMPNALEIGDWFGASRQHGLVSLERKATQVPCETHVISVTGDRYASRMHSMILPIYSSIQRYSAKKPVLIYVSSRRQTLLTCQDLLRLASLHEKPNMFVSEKTDNSQSPSRSTSGLLRGINDHGLRQTIPKGIGLCHAGLSTTERKTVEHMFQRGDVQILIATFDMARRLNAHAHQVILKGTEVFDQRSRRFTDIPIEDVKFMIGQAGRANVDETAYAVVFVPEPRRTLFNKQLHGELPLESSLLASGFDEILLREIVAGRAKRRQHVMNWLLNTFFFKRLSTNPGFYGLKKKAGGFKKMKTMTSAEQKVYEAERRQHFCEELISSSITKLKSNTCIETEGNTDHGGDAVLRPTQLGQICAAANIFTVSTRLLFDNVNEIVSPEDAVNLVCKTVEIAEISQKYDEETLWPKLFERVVKEFTLGGRYSNVELAAKGLKVVGWQDLAQKRAKLLMYSFMIDTTKRIEEALNRANAYRTFMRMVHAGAAVSAERGSLDAVKQFVRLGQSMAQGRIVTDNFWDISGFAGTRISEKATELGFSSMMDVLMGERDFAVLLAQNCAEAERGSIMRWLNVYPRIENVVVERGSPGHVSVSIQARNAENCGWISDSSSRGEGSVQASFTVVVWSELTGKVIGMGKVSDGEHGEKGDDRIRWMRTEVRIRGGDSSRAAAWVGSDAWIGVEGEGRVKQQR